VAKLLTIVPALSAEVVAAAVSTVAPSTAERERLASWLRDLGTTSGYKTRRRLNIRIFSFAAGYSRVGLTSGSSFGISVSD